MSFDILKFKFQTFIIVFWVVVINHFSIVQFDSVNRWFVIQAVIAVYFRDSVADSFRINPILHCILDQEFNFEEVWDFRFSRG